MEEKPKPPPVLFVVFVAIVIYVILGAMLGNLLHCALLYIGIQYNLNIVVAVSTITILVCDYVSTLVKYLEMKRVNDDIRNS